MRRFLAVLWANVRLDTKTAWRNGFFAITIALVAAYAAAVNWLIPPSFEAERPTIGFVDRTDDQRWKSFLALQEHGFQLYSDRSLLEQEARDHGIIGVVAYEKEIILIAQGYEQPKTVTAIEEFLRFSDQMIQKVIIPPMISTENLHPHAVSLPMNLRFIPVLLATDVMLIAFFLISAMLFNEKKERSLFAYRVSPGGTYAYILSKVLVNVGNCLLFSLLFLIATNQWRIDLWPFILMVALSSGLMSFLGLLLAQFYDSLMDFLYIILGVTLIALLPAIPYFNPSIGAPVFQWIPSYPVFFGVHRLLEGASGIPWQMFMPALVLLAVLIPLTGWSFGKTTMKRSGL